MSLVPAIEGKATLLDRTLFWEHEGNRAIRTQNWKLVARNDKPWELYNLTNDPIEANDFPANFPTACAQCPPSIISGRGTGVLPWKAVTQRSAAKP